MNCELSISNVFPALVGCFALLTLCYGESTSSPAPAQVPLDIATNVSLDAEMNTNQVEGTGSLILKAVLTNNSTSDVAVSLVSKVLDCEVSIRNASGESMPTTRFAKQTARNAYRLGQRVVTIRPHGTCCYEVPVNRLYDMTYPDRYRVTAKVRVSVRWAGQSLSFDAESAPLDVTVLRPAQE